MPLNRCTPHPRLVLVDGDIGKKETAAKCVETAMKHFGTIDVLVNNAGIYYTKAFTEFTTPLVEVRQFNSFQPGMLRRRNGLSRRAARLIRRFAMKRTESTNIAPPPVGNRRQSAIARNRRNRGGSDDGDHARWRRSCAILLFQVATADCALLPSGDSADSSASGRSVSQSVRTVSHSWIEKPQDSKKSRIAGRCQPTIFSRIGISAESALLPTTLRRATCAMALASETP